MPEKDNVALNQVDRAIYLVSIGVHSRVIKAAIDRSGDEYDLGRLLGLLEDLLVMGCTIGDPSDE